MKLNLNLCLRITYVPNYVIKSQENGDYVSNYASNLTDNDALVPIVHQQIGKLVEEVMKEHDVKVMEYVISFGEQAFVAFFVNDGVPSVKVFRQEEEAEQWRNTIATDNWKKRFVDDPPKVGIADEYFGRMPVSTYFRVYPADFVM